MSTEFFNDQWRIPSNENQNKVSNYSMDFDGSSDFININSLASTLGSKGSFSAWVNVADWSSRVAILGFAFDADNFLRFGVRPDNNNCVSIGGQFNNVSHEVLSNTTSLYENVWYHVVATSDGSVYKLYINGQLQNLTILAGSNNGNWVSDFSSTANKGSIGSLNRTGPSEDFFNGKIDQVNIFDYELSQDQVTQLGAEGYAFNFNGSTQAIDCGAGSRFDIDQITISNWVKFDSVSANLQVMSGIRNTSNGLMPYMLSLYNNAGIVKKLRFTINQSSDSEHKSIYSNDIIVVDTWYHVVGVADGSNVKLYVNGVLQTDQTTYDGTITSPTQNFNIGRQPSAPLYYLDGELSNISVFNTGLSSTDVQTLYNSGKPLADMSSFTSLQGWWKLDETATFNSGTSVWSIPDDSSNSNTGTSVGMNSSNLVASNINGELIANPMITSPKPIAYYQLGDQSVSTGPSSDYLVPNNSLSDYVFDFPVMNYTVNPDKIFLNNQAQVFNNATNFSFSGWFKINVDRNQNIFEIKDGSNYRFNINYYSYAEALRINIDTSGAGNYADAQNVISDGKIAIGEWFHYAGVFNGSGSTNADRTKLYINGQEQTLNFGGTQATSLGAIGATNTISLGNLINNIIIQFGGQASNIQMWDASLSSPEVTTLYNNGSPYTGTQPQSSNLRFWYKLNASEIFNSTSTEWSIDNNAYPSVYKSSLNFNGSSNYLDTPQINLGSTNSISFWINTTTTTEGTIFGDPNGSSDYALFSQPSLNRTAFRLGNNDSGYYQIEVSSGLLNDGNWHHHCLTRDGITINYYIDGILQTNVINNTLNASAGTNTTIENIFAKPDASFKYSGKLSNVALFDSALTGTQVQTIYNNGTPEASISHSPTSWYKLNNLTTGIQDSAGSNNGTNNGATEYAGFVNGLAGKSSRMTSANLVVSDLQQTSGYSPYALDFDGINDFLNAGSASYLNGLSEFSISVWINLPTAADNKTIISDWNYNTSPFGHFALKTWNTSGSNFGLLLFIKQPSDAGSNGVSIPAVLTQGNWHNVVFSYDSGTVTCYVDGSVVAVTVSGTIPTTLTSQDGILTIGNWPGLSQYWPGKLSNIALWNTELTQANATEIYNQGVPSNLNTFSGTKPTSWWQIGSNSSFNPNPTGTEGTWTCLDEIGTNNAIGSANMTNDDIVNGPGYSANGLGASSIDIKGDAPYSTANGLSENMDVLDRVRDTPTNLQPITNTHSIQLDGIDDYVDFGDSDDLSFGNGTTDSPFSISAWVKPDSTTKFKLFGKFDSSNTNYEYQFGTSNSKNLVLSLYNQNTADRIQRYYNNPLTSLDWQHWVATYDGSGNPDNIKIYINGVQVGDTSVTVGTYTAMQNTAAPLLIASESVNYANGLIDEVAIFKVELTGLQVAAIYNGGTPNNILPLSPVLWSRFESLTTNAGVVTTADSSGNGLTGTVENGAVLSTNVP